MTNPGERAARLACWKGDVAPVPLGGGITNVNFIVDDAGERYVVRIGGDGCCPTAPPGRQSGAASTSNPCPSSRISNLPSTTA